MLALKNSTGVPTHENAINIHAAGLSFQTQYHALSGPLTMRRSRDIGAQVLIGRGIGAGHVGTTLRELRRDVLAGAQFMVVRAGMTLVFAEDVALAGLAPSPDAFLAFAFGGQAERWF